MDTTNIVDYREHVSPQANQAESQFTQNTRQKPYRESTSPCLIFYRVLYFLHSFSTTFNNPVTQCLVLTVCDGKWRHKTCAKIQQ